MDLVQNPFAQVDRNATVEIKISEDNRQAHFDFERSPFVLSPCFSLSCPRVVWQIWQLKAVTTNCLCCMPQDPLLVFMICVKSCVLSVMKCDGQRRQLEVTRKRLITCRMPFKFTGDEDVLQEMGLCNPNDPLTARALSAAGDALSPRPAGQQAGQRPNGSSKPLSLWLYC